MMKFCKSCDSIIIEGNCLKCSSRIFKERKINIKIVPEEKKKISKFIMKKEKISISACKDIHCESKEAYISKHQIRAGDEAETLICTCILCNNTWRT